MSGSVTTVLVANRGEIARRIFATVRRLGLRTAAVRTLADGDALHAREADRAVLLPGASLHETYLSVDAVVAAAAAVDADAIHPGYGFLSESPAFAEAVLAAGLTWIGPPPDAMRSMADKLAAKTVATRAGMPVPPSALLTGDDPASWLAAGEDVGYPLLVKAAAGGGGRGMRVVTGPAQLADAVVGARREAAAAFGDATVFAERYLARGRHVEIQVLADTHGRVVHLGERECSIQRRHQKVLEEAPSPAVDETLRNEMGAAAVALARAIDYIGVGTVEYLLDESGAFWFLEMNTRLQVEHPVTEAVTGLDLVEWQLRVARGEPLTFDQCDVRLDGHAIEARLTAEDPARDWLPSTGTITRWAPGPTAPIRIDSAVTTGSEVSPAFDPLLAKVIVHAADRSEAAARLARALDELAVHGVATSKDLLAAVLRETDFLAGDTSTAFLDDHPSLLSARPATSTRRAHLLAAEWAERERQRRADPVWGFVPRRWRNVGSSTEHTRWRDLDPETAAWLVDVGHDAMADAVRPIDADAVEVTLDGVSTLVTVHHTGDAVWCNGPTGQTAWFLEIPDRADGAGPDGHGPTAPVPGRVVSVEVTAGDLVEAGRTLVVLEAMKVEHRVIAARSGVVEAVLVAPDDRVEAHQLLVRLVAHDDGTR